MNAKRLDRGYRPGGPFTYRTTRLVTRRAAPAALGASDPTCLRFASAGS